MGHVLSGEIPSAACRPSAGVVLLSDAGTGELLAELDAGAVTALRTGAAAVLAAETLARSTVAPAAVIGCGVNGAQWPGRSWPAGAASCSGTPVPNARAASRRELGAEAVVAGDRAAALAADIVVTVTPGREVVFDAGALHAGQHVSLMGADGPGKAEIAVERAPSRPRRLRRLGAGEPLRRHRARGRGGGLSRGDVAELGRVLVGEEEGRTSEEDITVFDSTGLAVQDLAVAVAVHERYREDTGDPSFEGVLEVEVG